MKYKEGQSWSCCQTSWEPRQTSQWLCILVAAWFWDGCQNVYDSKFDTWTVFQVQCNSRWGREETSVGTTKRRIASKLKLSTQLLICLLPITFSHPTDLRHLTWVRWREALLSHGSGSVKKCGSAVGELTWN